MKIILLSENAKVPQRAENGSAGYDLYTPNDFIVKPGRSTIPLDIQIELPLDTEGTIRPRSGFSLKGMEGYALSDPNKTVRRFDADVLIGTIDESYRGIVGVIIKSCEKEAFVIPQGTKVAQMVIAKYCKEEFEIADNLSETARGTKGYGEY